LYFHYQNWRAKRSYRKWLAKQSPQPKFDVDSLENSPKVSFILNLPARQGDEELLSTIHSIQNLNSDSWEIILVVNGNASNAEASTFSEDKHVKLFLPEQDDILSLISGDYLVFCSAGDRFHPHSLSLFFKSLNENPSADIYTSDCDYSLIDSSKHYPFFKPTALSPELLLSVNYLSRGFIKIHAISEYLSTISFKENILSIEYDIVLRLIENGHALQHIPVVLVSQSNLVKADDPLYEEVIKSHLARVGLIKPTAQRNNAMLRFSWQQESPSISIIIPTRNHVHLLKNLISSIYQNMDYRNFTINLVDNDSDDEETLTYYETLKQKSGFSIIPYHGQFNYAKAINIGARNTQSDLLLFLNDDMEVIDPHWLQELSQWAMRPEIGVVGAKLLRENKTIQHAGIIMGLVGLAGHIYLNAPEHYHGLFGSVDWYRNYLAVTGACQMVRREVFDQVGGYDEGFQIAFGDIDFCLRIHELGYRNVYTPFARLYHFEGKSRGYSTPVKDIKRAYEKYEKYLEKHDPYFSPNLTYTRIPKCAVDKSSIDNRKQQIEERKKFYLSDIDK
jgi:GT2 family glycosyltransferase